ncbi:50S ribosomal L12, cyanelle [Olea europaea subsp. europaea]|uniref:Large ribosomal subunit protein bL12c n=1 Tax=Olea europaea subsp. europaea TaxID=158383 RepID=A0A8S0UI01_OLEEU|nr:50S ribosomal L12, cyanelle [Olea europaea subsp. europaea]
MPSMISYIPSRYLVRTLSSMTRTFSTGIETQNRTEKLERIADELLSLNKIERFDYAILLRHKMGLNRFGLAASGAGLQSTSAASGGSASAAVPQAVKEKTAFDVKLEKFDASAKLKVIKEIRAFTDLGLKEAKDLVEKAPVVVKKGMPKDEAEKIVEKLKEVGATVVLE